jgi:hypothetical protein
MTTEGHPRDDAPRNAPEPPRGSSALSYGRVMPPLICAQDAQGPVEVSDILDPLTPAALAGPA